MLRIQFAHNEGARQRHAIGNQRRIADPVDYMRRARAHRKKRECGSDHDWDGPILPTGTPREFAFRYCKHCKAVEWVSAE